MRLRAGPLEFDLVPRVAERAAVLADALQRTEADVICLQEVFEHAHATVIENALAPLFPYAAYTASRQVIATAGLMILSRDPIHALGFHEGDAQGVEMIAPRGALLIRFDDGPLAGAVLANAHLPYGGFGSASQTSRSAIKIRDRTLTAIDAALREHSSARLLVGDLNFGPYVATENYTTLRSLGYTMVSNGEVTWDRENPLNRMFPFSDSQTIDHIAVAGEVADRVLSATSGLQFTEPWPLADGRLLPLSDHYAVHTDLHLSDQESAA